MILGVSLVVLLARLDAHPRVAGEEHPGRAPSRPALNEPSRLVTWPWRSSSFVFSPKYQTLPWRSCAYQSLVTSRGFRA